MTEIGVLLLIISPVEIPTEAFPPASAWAALREVNHRLELWDKKNGYGERFDREIKWSRLEWRESWDWPYIADVPLPDYEVCLACRQLNLDYQQWLERQAWRLWRAKEIDAAMTEARRLERIWQAAAEATSPAYSLTYRRKKLVELRHVELPPPIPMEWLGAD